MKLFGVLLVLVVCFMFGAAAAFIIRVVDMIATTPH